MNIGQQSNTFRPIFIEFDKEHEAKAFFNLIDKLDDFYANDGAEFTPRSFTVNERKLIIAISNARTNKQVDI